ncbi:putative ribosome quality control (RQC) complex YloA/Tae2 family protein [Methanohalophilus levihalophilus]|uniref:ribosome rescue protein RqcH n=1 Tax=Methanohalophilus levihalophilus TaxID=1431282 RepID=UPI001AE1D7FE|nr:ribosome rescue protein RqcH [Methanohalophilus levihalophilus]MBP2030873.1 putative ribosome quality control (RQC) complex YloA/Tae2 family protein [Methanohalophilus levihalophilus]
MKEEMTSADVAALISEFNNPSNTLVDAKIGKIYQPAEGELRIALNMFKRGRQNLVIELGKRLHLSQYVRPSPTTPQAFPMLLRKHIMGGRILSINQYDFDRIVEIHIIRGGETTILVVELFGQGNVVLLDNERRIILPMKPVTFKGRRIRRGEIYQYPEAQASPLDIDGEQLFAILQSSNADVVRTIASRFNLGGVYAEEVCLRCGIDKTREAISLNEAEIESLIEGLKEVFKPLTEGELKPCIVRGEQNGNLVDINVIPFELQQYSGAETECYESFNKALDEFFGKHSAATFAEQKESVKKEKVDVLARRLQQQEDAISKFGKEIDTLTEIAERIYEYYQDIEGLLGVLSSAREKGYSWQDIRKILDGAKEESEAARAVVNIDSSRGVVTMNLNGAKANIDVRKTVPQNALVYYEKVKKLEKKRKGALEAIEQTRKQMKKRDSKKEAAKRKAFVKKHWYDRFRWFVSSDGFFVVAGRDATTNEDIVKKYMEKRDIVFHTQAPGAPMTVIKTEGKEVPQSTLDEVARFVVSNSSIWKAGQFAGDCYWILPEQVTKTPESGEYLKKGSFVIRGDRNYMRDVPVSAAVGLELGKETRVIGGPLSAVQARAEHVIEIVPGKFNQNDLAKKIYRMYVEKLQDVHFVKQIASPDKIAMMLPPGGSELK